MADITGKDNVNDLLASLLSDDFIDGKSGIDINHTYFVNSTSDAVREQLDDLFRAILQIIAETLYDGSDIAS